MEQTVAKVEALKSWCINLPGAYETRPFGEYPICYRVMGKIFAQFNPEPLFYKITLKCKPEQAYFYRSLFPGVVVRGYHCPPVQQPYWNTVDLDAFTDETLLYQMIEEAYAETVCKLTQKSQAQLSKLATLRFLPCDGTNVDLSYLCSRLDLALDELVGAKFQRSQYNQFNLLEDIHDALVVYKDGKPVGCGAFKMYDEEHAELKRIYTEPDCRGIGLGAEIIRRLEAMAKIQGYRYCILETGKPLEAACHVYEKLGYKVIPNYGQYANMPNSVCMQRKI